MLQTTFLLGKNGMSLTVQPDCVEGPIVSGTVYGDMHLKDLGSVARIGYCIPVPDFYLVLHGLSFDAEKHSNEIINISIEIN